MSRSRPVFFKIPPNWHQLSEEEQTLYAEAVLAAILEAASAEDTEFGRDDETTDGSFRRF